MARRLTEWILGAKGILSNWNESWFRVRHVPGRYPISGDVNWVWWELAKSNGILHCFLYYLRHIDDNPLLREKTEKGIMTLSTPEKARMSGVMAEPEEFYGRYAVQATGFAGLSLAEYVEPDSIFGCAGKGR